MTRYMNVKYEYNPVVTLNRRANEKSDSLNILKCIYLLCKRLNCVKFILSHEHGAILWSDTIKSWGIALRLNIIYTRSDKQKFF